jgi:hypothetical protein
MEGVIYNTRLLTYDIKVKGSVSSVMRYSGYQDLPALNVVCTNLIACLRKGQVLVYSRDKSNTPSRRKGVTTMRVIKAIAFLELKGYLVNTVGKPHKDPEKRVISFVVATELFKSLFRTDEIRDECERLHAEALPVVELRDVNKKPVDFRSNPMIDEMKQAVKKLNEVNEKTTVLDELGNPITNIYCRIFNESFEYGGRFYKADVLQIKNKTTSARLGITIDGEPVVEVDFGNLHFRIVAAKEGIDTYDIPADIYADMLEDHNNLIDREIVKLAVNMMFNCYDEKTAIKAIQGEINKLSKEDKLEYTLGNAKSVMMLIYHAYPDFVDYFCSEESYGRRLQNEDSHLAASILSVFIDKGIPILPVHDSFIVARSYENLLIDTMADKFRERFGAVDHIPVTISHKDDGKVTRSRAWV